MLEATDGGGMQTGVKICRFTFTLENDKFTIGKDKIDSMVYIHMPWNQSLKYSGKV